MFYIYILYFFIEMTRKTVQMLESDEAKKKNAI